MSEGIIILISKGEPTEYRVSYVPHVDTLYSGIDPHTGKWLPNNDAIIDNFFTCDVYTTIDLAYDAAETMSYNLYRELESGISIMREFEDRRFDSY